MKTGKTLHGSANLVFDAVEATTHIVEGMYRNIAAAPLPLGEAPIGPAQGIAGLVHASIRTVNHLTRRVSEPILAHMTPSLDRTLLPGPQREAIICALNGVCGDHLARTGNTLAIPMQLRVPQQTRPATGRRLLILAHGLCMNDRHWTSHEHNHAEALAHSNDYTPVYVLYNSGRNVSINGRQLCEQITDLLETWPVQVDSITFIGFSMGGLVARSAMHIAKDDGHAWLDKVDKAAYIGTPHHGAAMERGGYWLQKSLTYSPYTLPLSALGRIRSDGITDLRHGNVSDNDWQHHDEHEDNSDRRQPTPLAYGVKHYAIAATLSKCKGERIGELLGDGLVHPSSATGKHDNQNLHLAFPEGHTKIIYGIAHLAMLHDSRVFGQLREWLGKDH